jgi:DNA topoisomerase I
MSISLRYVDDSVPGVTRTKSGKSWRYFDAKGRPITRRGEIERLNAIALPPAYVDAWFCPHRNGHIQAVGWDAKGRKQYRYHIDFRSAREADKYALCADFGRALPAIRKRVERDLARRAINRDTIIAAVVRLLDRGRVRIGNENYARANKSYGATTLRKRHVRVFGKSINLEYVGKSGKMQAIRIEDNRLARVVRRCLDESETNLFEYVDTTGTRRGITSSEVNQYLREASGQDFTAKHFRTWGASVIALDALLAPDVPLTMKAMLEPVAAALGNTPTIARKSYVHPTVIALVSAPKKIERMRLAMPRQAKFMSSGERMLLKVLTARRTMQSGS